MTVSISKMSVSYYIEQVTVGDAAPAGTGSRDLTRYYTEAGAPPGRWIGSGTVGLGIDTGTRVTSQAARRLLEDSAHPETGERLGRAPIAKQQAPAGAKTAAGKAAKSERESVAGFDLTFSVPKSVSVLWAMADDQTKAAVHAAHRRAIDDSLSWLDDRVIQTRAGHAGVAKVATRGLIATAFDHWDSRAGDPQLHTHVVIANRVQRASDGAWTTLDSVALHKNVVAASERFNGILFDELARTLGTQAEIRGESAHDYDDITLADRNARIELAGVPGELIDAFSSRSRVIEAETDRLIAKWEADHGTAPTGQDLAQLRQQATLTTRTAKDPDSLRSLEEKSSDWRLQASALGHTAQDVVAAATGHEPTITAASDPQPETLEEIASRAVTAVAVQRTTFTRANVHAEISRSLAAVRCHSADERDRLLDELTDQALDQTVRLTPTRFQHSSDAQPGLSTGRDHAFNDSASYATQDQLSAEERLISAATNTGAPTITDRQRAEQILDAVTVGDGHSLAPDQREAALRLATADQSLSALIGPAGTGKTTCLSALRQVWEDEHGPGSIVGLAPSAVAASVLGKEIDVPTDNVAKWLWESEGPGAARRHEKITATRQQMTRLLDELPDSPTAQQQRTLRRLNATLTELETTQDRYQMRPGQMVIVDEASMAGTHSLDRLRAQAETAGARIVAVGDPSQLGAIEAGGTLGWIERHQDQPNVTAATLESVWRFKNDWEAGNSLALRQGEHDAIDTLLDHDRITQVDEPEAVETTAFDQWADARTQGSALLLSASQESVDRLNLQAQDLLRSTGEIDHTTTVALSGDSVAGLGDRILTRRNERQVLDDQGNFIKNGDLLTVTALNDDGTLEAARDNGATVHLPTAVLENTQLGYASTAHRAQGVTVDRAITAVDPNQTSRETFYVSMTRGKHSNTAVLPPPAPDDESPDPWQMIHRLTPQTAKDQLARVLDRTDTELTAHEVRDHAHGWDNDLTRLTDELRYTGQAIATRQTVQWVRDAHGSETADAWADSEHWPAIVNAVTAGRTLPSNVPDTSREALDALKAQPTDPDAQRRHGPLQLPIPETTDETTTVQRLVNKIDDRLAGLRAQSADEPWRLSLTGRPQQTIDSVLIARQLSSWDDPAQPLPPDRPSDPRAASAVDSAIIRIESQDSHQQPVPETFDHSEDIPFNRTFDSEISTISPSPENARPNAS